MNAARPLIVYDGDCGFCRRWIARWRRWTGKAVDYAPYQEVAARFPEIAPARFAAAVHLREPDGSWHSGAAAALRALALGGRPAAWWCYRRLPGFAALAEAGYRWVARRRTWLGRVTP